MKEMITVFTETRHWDKSHRFWCERTFSCRFSSGLCDPPPPPAPPIGSMAMPLLLHHRQCLDSMGGFCLRLYPEFIRLQDGVQKSKRLCTIAIYYCNKWLLNSKYPSLLIELHMVVCYRVLPVVMCVTSAKRSTCESCQRHRLLCSFWNSVFCLF